jgi:hypothetical protein
MKRQKACAVTAALSTVMKTTKAFLSKHAIFRDHSGRNPIDNQNEILHKLIMYMRLPEVLEMVGIV